MRLGITGAPGAGKSTTIDILGTYLTSKGHKVAVLAVDPSSSRTGGSILGDKTRMGAACSGPKLHLCDPPLLWNAWRRCGQDTRDHVGLRGRRLRCRHGQETVGIGQSETAVADMTDFFLC